MLGTPLIANLRGHFAEFLNEGYIERLSIFSSSTCVGLRYERLSNSSPSCFLAAWCRSVRPFRGLGSSDFLPRLLGTKNLNGHIQPAADLTFCVTERLVTLLKRCRNILPCCPSPTPFGLSLGSTNPPLINIAGETLDFRRADFSPAFSLLIPT